jgi:hypothetical protein
MTKATRALHRMASAETVRSSQDSVSAKIIADRERRSSLKVVQPTRRFSADVLPRFSFSSKLTLTPSLRVHPHSYFRTLRYPQ